MFEGAYTAIVTPFNQDGSVDYGNLQELVEFQIENGIDGIVPVGTTGESPTLNMAEHSKVIETTIETANKRVKIIAGTGANSTSEAIELTKHAKEAGADGSLQVTPYYNKPSQEGLKRHFTAVADLGLPIVLYNVPGRAAREIAVDTIVELSKHPHVAAVKEAGGSADRVSQILSQCDIEILSGDDMLTLPMMCLGAVGVISVASNIIPQAIADMVHATAKCECKKARDLHYKYYNLFTAMFLDTNPVPVKAAMAMLGRIDEVYRLPLCAMNDGAKAKLKERLSAVGLV